MFKREKRVLLAHLKVHYCHPKMERYFQTNLSLLDKIIWHDKSINHECLEYITVLLEKVERQKRITKRGDHIKDNMEDMNNEVFVASVCEICIF